jgi:hypothetical protein
MGGCNGTGEESLGKSLGERGGKRSLPSDARPDAARTLGCQPNVDVGRISGQTACRQLQFETLHCKVLVLTGRYPVRPAFFRAKVRVAVTLQVLAAGLIEPGVVPRPDHLSGLGPPSPISPAVAARREPATWRGDRDRQGATEGSRRAPRRVEVGAARVVQWGA